MSGVTKAFILLMRQHHPADWRQHPIKWLRLTLAARAWAVWIPVLAQGKDLRPLLDRAGPGSGTPYAGLSVDAIARCCTNAVRRPILMADRPCLRAGLLLNRFLVMAGYAPTLHLGIDRTSVNSPRMKAHCWIKLGDRVFNPPDANMMEIHVHQSGREESSGSLHEAR